MLLGKVPSNLTISWLTLTTQMKTTSTMKNSKSRLKTGSWNSKLYETNSTLHLRRYIR